MGPGALGQLGETNLDFFFSAAPGNSRRQVSFRSPTAAGDVRSLASIKTSAQKLQELDLQIAGGTQTSESWHVTSAIACVESRNCLAPSLCSRFVHACGRTAKIHPVLHSLRQPADARSRRWPAASSTRAPPGRLQQRSASSARPTSSHVAQALARRRRPHGPGAADLRGVQRRQKTSHGQRSLQ